MTTWSSLDNDLKFKLGFLQNFDDILKDFAKKFTALQGAIIVSEVSSFVSNYNYVIIKLLINNW